MKDTHNEIEIQITEAAAHDFDRLLSEVLLANASHELLRVKDCQHRVERLAARQSSRLDEAHASLKEALEALAARTRYLSLCIPSSATVCENPECGKRHFALLVGVA